MEFIQIAAPSYPFLIYAGDALYRPGDFHRQRNHLDVFDVLFVESGCLYMMEGGKKYDVRQNHVLVLHPHHMHRGYRACDTQTYFHWLHFDTAEKYEVSSTFQGDLQPERDLAHKRIQPETLVLPVFQKLKGEDAAYVFHVLSDLESLAINRYRQSSMISKDVPPISDRLKQQELFLSLLAHLLIGDEKSNSNRIAHMTMQYLQANYAQDITLSDLAVAANCHPTHVIRCFRQEYGTTPGKALLEIRIEQAKDILDSSNPSCERVSEQVGFSSASYSSKTFKANTGLSPQQYRKEGRHQAKRETT